LDELLANAAHYADYCMNNSGRVTPTCFLLAADGQCMLTPQSLADTGEKEEFANLLRLACIAHDATACVMVLEAWAKFATPGEPLDTTEAPSEAIDRKEFVILTGESRQGNRQQFLPIVRYDNGKFFRLGDPYEPGADMKGRFAQILPPDKPDAAAREVARAMLQAKQAPVAPLPFRR
jgi:hypothetical protein